MRPCILFLILCFILNGCGTFGVTAKTGIPYSGTISDATVILHPTLSIVDWLIFKPFFLWNLPFTLLGDTLLLPFLIL